MIRTAALAGIFMALALPVAAQPTNKSPAEPTVNSDAVTGQGTVTCPVMGMGAMGSGNPRTEGRLAFLRTELKITDAQEKAWNAYADVLRAVDRREGPARRGMMGQGRMGPGMMPWVGGTAASAPEALKQRIDFMEDHLKDLKKIQSATTKLYGALDETQKKTADDLLGMPYAMGHGMGPMGWGAK